MIAISRSHESPGYRKLNESALCSTTSLKIKGKEYQFRVSQDPSEYEPVRDRIRTNLGKRFSGWSDDHDRQFDDSAVFFLLADTNGELKAGIRMIISRPGSTVIPVSLTDRACEINFDGALEYSGLWFDQFRHCRALAALTCQWVDIHFNNCEVYSIFESSNRILRRVYLQVCGFETLEHPPIVYEGFVYADSGESVEWELTVCKPSTRNRRAMTGLAIAGVTSRFS